MNDNTINADVTMDGAGATLLANRYRVVHQLGQGGMGAVWLAEDTELDNRQVAIKMLPSILLRNKRAYNQIKTEALVSLKLAHPNIATLRSFEENSGNPFLVIDYIDGQTLDDYLAEKGNLNVAETISLLSPVAAALDYAHSKNVIHRDIKPANVMIDKDGTPYILDFGIAREMQETLTRVTGRLSSGTLMYMSPEQLHGAAPSAVQDVYSFAAMVYECLTGNPPFYRGQIEYQIEHDQPAPLNPSFSIGAAVIAALAKDPANRPTRCVSVLAGKHGLEDSVVPLTFVDKTNENTSCVRNDDRTRGVEERGAGTVKKILINHDVAMEMVYCPPGAFKMGSPVDECGRQGDEVLHEVTLSSGYWIARYPVTCEQWIAVMGSANIGGAQNCRMPMERISWEDCQEFCRRTGKGLRLPTEAEWEYACRAGSMGLFGGESNDVEKFLQRAERATLPVGNVFANRWNIFDMNGNVWEWCLDYYGSYSEEGARDPLGQSNGDARVIRGGCWDTGTKICRSAARSSAKPGFRSLGLGFRVCCKSVF